MKHFKTIFSSTLAFLAVVGAINMSTPTQAQNSQLLSSLKNGLWQFRDKSRGGDIVDAICIGDVTRLVKIKNKDDACTLKMYSSSANSVTYDYVCSGKGKGRTTIRKENNSLVQISSQGITDGHLFNFKLEARYAGSCR